MSQRKKERLHRLIASAWISTILIGLVQQEVSDISAHIALEQARHRMLVANQAAPEYW